MGSIEARDGGRRPETEDHVSLSADAVFETLSSRRRRYVLYYFRQIEPSATIRDLSEQLAAWENDCDRSQVRPKERKRLYTALHQTHLPKMANLGVVDYDRNRGVAKLATDTNFDDYLGIEPDEPFQWSQLYLGLGGVLTVLLGAASLGLAPFGLGAASALVVAAALTLFAAYQTVRGDETSPGLIEPLVPSTEATEGDDG
jgi:hypothetical protein